MREKQPKEREKKEKKRIKRLANIYMGSRKKKEYPLLNKKSDVLHSFLFCLVAAGEGREVEER